MSIILWLFGISRKLERWKSLISASWADQKLKKKKTVLSVVFSYSMQQQWIISWSDCDVWWKLDFIWQPVMTSSMIGQRRSSKALPKAKLGAKNGHNHCLVICCSSDPLQLSKSWRTITSETYAQKINEMHQKLQCLQSTLVNRKGPILHDNAWMHVTQATLQKLNVVG